MEANPEEEKSTAVEDEEAMVLFVFSLFDMVCLWCSLCQLKSVKEAIADIESRLNEKAQLRSRIQAALQNRPEESFFSKLDSSIKKNTAFVRKLKNFTEAQKESIMKDINSLNLTKYISEVASGIVEAKLKMTDIPSIIQVCATLHEKYVDFSSQLLEAWQKVLVLKKDEKVT